MGGAGARATEHVVITGVSCMSVAESTPGLPTRATVGGGGGGGAGAHIRGSLGGCPAGEGAQAGIQKHAAAVNRAKQYHDCFMTASGIASGLLQDVF